MNEMANLAERLGADIEAVRHGVGSDPRIGYQFIYPRCGYGGSCFSKEVQALVRTANYIDYKPSMLEAVEKVNDRQKKKPYVYLNSHFKSKTSSESLAGKTIAVLGLSFKPNTDYMREASSRILKKMLWENGAKVQAYGPEAMEESQRIMAKEMILAIKALHLKVLSP